MCFCKYHMVNKVDMDSIVSKPLNTKERSSLMHVIGHTCITTEFGVNYRKAAYVNGKATILVSPVPSLQMLIRISDSQWLFS